jgi:signal transduction histidine kinase/ligand-binding sensor domain-containing protein
MNKRLFPIFLVFIYMPLIVAQEGFAFKHINSENGLTHNTVQAIYKDKYGFMWFGTERGLNKYDGRNFTAYYNDPNDPTSIVNDQIVAIGEDSYDNLWFGSDFYGLSRYDRKKDIFENYTYNPKNPNNPFSVSSNNIRAIFEDSNKKLWIATTGGCLNIYDHKTNTFKRRLHDPNRSDEIGSHYITSIAEDSKGNIWFASSEFMLCKYSPKTDKFTNYKFLNSPNPNFHSDKSYKICIDSDDDLWFTTEIGLLKFEQKTGTYTHYSTTGPGPRLNNNVCTGVVEYKKEIIFVLTDHGGLNVINKYTNQISYVLSCWFNNSKLSNNQLYSVFKTKQGQIWIGTFSGGLNILDKGNNKFQKLENLATNVVDGSPTNSVLTICEDSNNDIWIGFDGQGIMIFNPITKKLQCFEEYIKKKDFLKDKAITDIVKDKDNNMWIGTYQWGIFKYTFKTKSIEPFDYGYGIGEGISEKNIKSLAIDNDNNLYIGTMSVGLIIYNIKNKTFNHYRFSEKFEKGLSGEATCKIFLTNDKKLWMSTFSGLNYIDPDKKKIRWFLPDSRNKFAIQALIINDIYKDQKDSLWFGTNQGLFKYLPDKLGFVLILDKETTKAKNIYSIQEDSLQNLWLGTDNGILKYSIHSKKIEYYNMQDGLQGKLFAIHSVARDSRGFLYFGGNKGLNIFKPEAIAKDTIPPPVFFASIKISNEIVNHKTHPEVLSENINSVKEVNLNYQQNNISFEFIALSYTNPDFNQYAYKLEGFDKEWNSIGTKNEVTFTNLNPGNYILKVKGANSDGTWNEQGTEIKIHISPPFWKTIWFIVLCAFGIILLFVLFFYVRMRQINAQNKLLQKMVDKRTKELNSKNEELRIQAESLREINVLLEENQLQVREQAEELLNQRDELFELNKMKDKMFSIISHDLKGPFGSLLGLSSLMVDKYEAFPEDQKLHSIKVIHDSHQSIYGLIDNLLSWSRAQRGTIDFSPKKADLAELLRENIKLVENQTIKKGIKVFEEFEKTPNFIYIDQDLINMVIRNLLSNAIKFTRKNGAITVGFCTLENKTKTWVKDNGIGISPDDIEKIFDKKLNFSTPGTNNEKGTGLGLILCKEFVEKHKGEIWVENQQEQGCTFFFTLPQIDLT